MSDNSNSNSNSSDSDATSTAAEPTPDDVPETAGEPAPVDGFESDIDLSDAVVTDEPVVVHVPGEGEGVARLMTQGEIEDLDAEGANLTGRELLDLLTDKYVTPDFSRFTTQDYKNSKAGFFQKFVQPLIDHPDDPQQPPGDFEPGVDLTDWEAATEPRPIEVEGRGDAVATDVDQAEFDVLIRRVQQVDSDDEATEELTEWFVERLQQHYHSPSLEELTVERYRQSKPGYFDPFITAIAREIGFVDAPGLGNS